MLFLFKMFKRKALSSRWRPTQANTRSAPVIDIPHHSNLEALLVIVALVDTESINPIIPTVFVLANLAQNIIAILWDLYVSAVNHDETDRVGISSCIR